MNSSAIPISADLCTSHHALTAPASMLSQLERFARAQSILYHHAHPII
jgi:hypothetical protein